MSESKDFGNIAVELGFITEQELCKYLDLQRLLKERGIDEPLEKILVQEDAITSLDARAIAQQIPIKLNTQQNVSPSTITPTNENIQTQSPTRHNGETQAVGAQALTQFGRYQIQKILGQGGAATVYKVYDPHLDREAALKVLTMGQVANQNQLKRFSLEIRTTAKLQHPGIVTIYETGIENNIPYFVMDCIQGINLKQYIYRCKPSIQEAISIIKKVATAIDYAHNQGVIHRDLKPENIMMDEYNNPRVMDFGLAKLKDDETGLSRTGEIIGTVKYMSPEQAEGVKHVDERTDIYALGAIFYEILVRQPPFEGQSYLQILNQVINNQPTPLCKINPEIPRDLEIICLKALRKKADNRYNSAAEFVEALEDFTAGKKISTQKKVISKRTTQKVITERRRLTSSSQRVVMGSSRVTQRIAMHKKDRREKKKHQTVTIVVCIIMFFIFMLLLSSSATTDVSSDNLNSKFENAANSNDTQYNPDKPNKPEKKVTQPNTKKEASLEEEAKNKLAQLPMLQNSFAMWHQLNSFDEKYQNTQAWQVVQQHKSRIEKGLLRELSMGIILFESNRHVPETFWQSFNNNLSLIHMMAQKNIQIKTATNRLLSIRDHLQAKEDTQNPKEKQDKFENTKRIVALEQEKHNFYFHVVLPKYIVKFADLDNELKKINAADLREQIKLRFDTFKENSQKLQDELYKTLAAKPRISVALKYQPTISRKITKTTSRYFVAQGQKYRYLTIATDDMVKILGAKAKQFSSILAIHFFCENNFTKAKEYWEFVAKNAPDYEVWKQNLNHFANIENHLQLQVQSNPIISRIEQTIPIAIRNVSEQDINAVTVTIESPNAFHREKTLNCPAKMTTYVELPFTVAKSIEYKIRVKLSIKEKALRVEKIRLKAERKKYGFYSDAWEKLYYRHNGHEIIDMTSPFWMKLSDGKKEDYAKTYQKYYAKFLNKEEQKTISVQGAKINMVFIPPGRFWLGSPQSEHGRNVKEIRHKVVISKAFWIQKEEMPQITWQKIAGTTPWSGKEDVRNGPIYPATYISFDRVKAHLLSKMGENFNLPTEAQWEYACRAGNTDAFFWGSFAKRGIVYSWSKNNSKGRPAIVRRKRPNNWGIHDMLGNVAEICRDGVRNYDEEQQVDPFYHNSDSDQRIMRGGHFGHTVQQLRCALRQNVSRGSYSHVTGVRIIMNEE